MSIWLPPDMGLDIAYSVEDFALFISKVCDTLSLTTLKKVVTILGNPKLIKQYIKDISDGRVPDNVGIFIEAVGTGQQKFHKQLFHIMYEIPLEEVPLYVNDDPDVLPVVSWRLEIAK
jgi:hypothetical protein